MIIVGIRFKEAGRIYYYSSGKIPMEQLTQNTPVIVETARGLEYGTVALERRNIDVSKLKKPLKQVLRLATPQDTAQELENKKWEENAKGIALERIAHHKLDMHLVNVDLTFDHNKITFFFTSDGRVDFRELVKDLAAALKTRIELRQIGARDEAKMLNGIGICGCTLCCATFLEEFQPVSIKSAKDQGLSLNPTKISGVCGKLMCCLKYEEEAYSELNKTMPGTGDVVRTADGVGTVVSVNVLKQTAKVALKPNGNEEPKSDIYSAADMKILERAQHCEEGCSGGRCHKGHR